MKKMSTMLGLIFFSSIFFTLHEAKAQTATLTINGKSVNVSASSCDDAKSLAATDYCVDEAGKLSIVTNVKTTEGVFGRTGKVVVKHRHLTKKELIAFARGHLHGQLGDDKNATVCTDGTGCTTVPTNNNSVTTTDNNSPNTNVSANDNVNTNVSNRPGRDRRRNRNRPSSTYRDDPRVQAQVDFDMLKDFCGGLEDRIIDRDQAIKDIDAQIAEIDEVALKNAEQKAYRDMLKGCRHNCIELAMVKDGVCSLDKKAMASVVSKEDLDHGLLGLGAWFGAQSAEGSWVATSQPTIDPTKICTKILGKPECKAEIVKSGLGDCPESVAWLAALKELTDAQLAIRELKAKQSTYAKNSTKGCNVSSAADVDSAHWDNCSSDCLQRALDSCPRALADAEYFEYRFSWRLLR
jgi:hypothetical protein